MSSNRRLVYWDSCIPVHYIEGTPEWLPILDNLLANSADQASELQLITSTFTITEVAFTEAEKVHLKEFPQAREAIESFWRSRAITLVELHELIAMEARDIVRRSMMERWKIKPNDAVHLATAQHLEVNAFHTLDKALLACDDRFPFRITAPDLFWSTKTSISTMPGQLYLPDLVSE